MAYSQYAGARIAPRPVREGSQHRAWLWPFQFARVFPTLRRPIQPISVERNYLSVTPIGCVSQTARYMTSLEMQAGVKRAHQCTRARGREHLLYLMLDNGGAARLPVVLDQRENVNSLQFLAAVEESQLDSKGGALDD